MRAGVAGVAVAAARPSAGFILGLKAGILARGTIGFVARAFLLFWTAMSRVAESDPGILEGSGYGFLKSSDPDQVCIGWIRTQFFFKMGHSGY